MTNHGGKRKGAGRPPAPKGTQKVAMTFRISPDVREYLLSQENSTEAIERAVRGTKRFREWKADK